MAQKDWKRPEGECPFGSADCPLSMTRDELFRSPDRQLRNVGDIRLLELQPNGGRGLLKARLLTVNLANKPLFSAVSYVWGDNRGSEHSIELEGKQFKVSPRLREVLQNLCQPSQSRVLWIDAICINQSDLEERNSQVAMMGQIFSAANQVIAYMWSDFLPGNVQKMQAAFAMIRDLRLTQSWRKQPEIVQAFFSHEYWTRRWIVQELTLARMITFQYQQITVTMGAVQRFLDRLTYEDSFLRLYETMANRIYRFRMERQSTVPSTEAVLKAYNDTVCKDPLDKVFALLSLMEEAKQHLKVDYNTSRLSLFFYALGCVSEHEQSSIVSCGSLLRSNLDLTSQEMSDLPGPVDLGPQTDQFFLTHVSGSTTFSTQHEETIRVCRGYLPNLSTFQSFTIKMKKREEGHGSDKHSEWNVIMENRTLSHEPLEDVSAQDMYPFTYPGFAGNPYQRLENIEPKSLKGLEVGLASIRVDAQDAIIRFCGTPVALIARAHPEGFSVIGRAYLLRSKILGEDPKAKMSFHPTTQAYNILEDVIDFNQRADTKIFHSTMHITLSPIHLLQLVKWTSLDDMSTHLKNLVHFGLINKVH